MHDPVKLDAFDHKILAELRHEGRLTNLELAERIGLSASQCSRRRSRLEEARVIRAYRAEIDPALMGRSVIAFVNVSIQRHSPTSRAKLQQFLIGHPAVMTCHAVTGEADYVLRVVTPELGDLNQFVLSLVDSDQEGLHVQSVVVLETIKE
jgi:DNA-binding Lrp family transcriptional regulator